MPRNSAIWSSKRRCSASAAVARLGPYPQVDVAIAVGCDDGARNHDAEPAGKPRQRGDRRDRERPTFFSARPPIQRGELRVGFDQTPVPIDSPAHGRLIDGDAHTGCLG
jgi:hypothetical protein